MTLALAAWSWTATLLLAAPSSDGVVVLPDGAPAADAVVWVVSRSLDTLRRVRTDAEGRFAMHIPAGPGTLHVRGPRGSARAAYGHTIEIDLVDEAKPDDALQIALPRRAGLLLDRELVADPDAWPVLLDLDEDRSAGHSARPHPSESKLE